MTNAITRPLDGEADETGKPMAPGAPPPLRCKWERNRDAAP
jgi:hypothetical protein